MARTPIIGGVRDGTDFVCTCLDVCTCESFGCGYENHALDGYFLWQMYRKVDGVFKPSHIKKETMKGPSGMCPRCDRFMPDGTKNCLNCGAEMDPFGKILGG